jgi:hypothetical protein
VFVGALLEAGSLEGLSAKSGPRRCYRRVDIKEEDDIRLWQAHFSGANPALVEALCQRVCDARERIAINDKDDPARQIFPNLFRQRPAVRGE